ncbi:MAG: ABC transporter ATP-binding protein [Candidatus Cloacimonetes bacterium]|nr:ABC transporter ATP-binding protein [Candidatus Cloacimonadota bacterium]
MNKFKRFLGYYKQYWVTIVVALILFVILTMLEIVSNILFKYTVDTVIPRKDIATLCYTVGAFIIINGLGLIFFYYTSVANTKVNLNVSIKLKTDLITKLHYVNHLYFNQNNQGYWFARIQNDATQLFSIFTDSLFTFLRSIIIVVLSLAVLFYYNWLLTLLILVCIPIHMLLSNKFMIKISNTSSKSQEQLAQRDRQLVESLSMLPHCMENDVVEYNVSKYHESLMKQFVTSMKAYIAEFKFKTFNTGIFELIPILVISVGGYSIITGKMTVGSLLLFIMMSQQLLGSISQMFSIGAVYTQAKVNIERINQFFETPEVKYDEVLTEFKTMELKNVEFSYTSKVLHDITLSVAKGDKIAIFGGSGSGKTTLLKVIFGLVEPEAGCVFVNDVPQSHVKYDLRECFCAIWQDPVFFNSTLIENVAYGASKGIVANLMTDLNIDFDKNKSVGDSGNNLSSGQKQRLSLLRGISRDTEVVLLDEPTVNLDVLNRSKVLDLISKLSNTVIIVTHDQELSALCNKVYTIKEGCISQI